MEKAKHIGIEAGLKYVYTYSEKGCDCAKDNHLFNSGISETGDTGSSCCSEKKAKLNFSDITFSMNIN
jgi:hypothetical protein